MLVGVLKEIKTKENRVAMTPDGVEQMLANGHEVIVETEAGVGSGFSNADYENAGAKIGASAREMYASCDMIMKVKEPLPGEYPLIREGQIVFTYFHFAASQELTQAVIEAIYLAGRTCQPEGPRRLLETAGLSEEDCLKHTPRADDAGGQEPAANKES